jgi:hypothetical protein
MNGVRPHASTGSTRGRFLDRLIPRLSKDEDEAVRRSLYPSSIA